MIKKIAIEELESGMFVNGLEKDGPESALFFMNNIIVKSRADVERFAGNGYRHAYIEVEDAPPVPLPSYERPAVEEVAAQAPAAEGAGAQEPAASSPAEPVEDPGAAPDACAAFAAEEPDAAGDADSVVDTVDFYEELAEARKIRTEAENLVRSFMSMARLDGQIPADRVHRTVGRMVDSIFRNQDALTSLTRLKSFDEYTFSHSINVCILSVTIGRHLGLSKDSLTHLGVGAILHDIGKMLVPEKVLNKPGALTDEEFRIIRNHPMLGADVLVGTRDINETSLNVALQHHERYDGTGYHKGLASHSIDLFARIAAVADVYDAMTSNRVYNRAMAPEEALKKMYLARGTHFDPEMVERLIRCLGIYPIGSLVELNTGELAVVRMANHTHPLQPVILMIADKDKRPHQRPYEVDLRSEIGRWVTATRELDPKHLPEFTA